jgi:hypothetical protein
METKNEKGKGNGKDCLEPQCLTKIDCEDTNLKEREFGFDQHRL